MHTREVSCVVGYALRSTGVKGELPEREQKRIDLLR